jgi:hypothetical protein
MRYSAAEDQLWHKHGRTVLHPKDAFDDAIRNGMDEEGKYHYMYMYSSETMHFFKHVDTREYVRVQPSAQEQAVEISSTPSSMKAQVRFVPSGKCV